MTMQQILHTLAPSLCAMMTDLTAVDCGLQSKLHLLQHDLDFLQSNLSYLTELGKRVDQYANQARATAAEQLAAYTAEVTRRQRVIALRDSLTNNKLLNELRFERSTALGDQVSDLRV